MSNSSHGSGNTKLGFIRFRVVIYIILLLSAALLVVLLLVSYVSALYFIFGILLALVAALLIMKLENQYNKMLLVSFLLIVITSLGVYFFPHLAHMTPCTPGKTLDFDNLKKYQVTIEPQDFSSGSFKIIENALYDHHHQECVGGGVRETVDKNVSVFIPESRLHSTSRGLLIQEIRFPILHGLKQVITPCNLDSQITELRNFPRNSFYEARYAHNIESLPYLDVETIRWKDECVDGEIVFAYVPSPFFLMRGILTPLIPLSYQSQWMITLLGLIIASIFIPITKPILFDFAKNKFKLVLENKQKKQEIAPPSKARIIVSGKGDEKEVEIDEKRK